MNNITKIKFSIIVVSLNTKKAFLETISSIINQTFNDYEIIVVDGFSEDGTREEIKKRQNKFSNIIIEKDNGIYDAMNKGIDKAKGKWVIFMNSGDTFYNERVLENFNLSNNEKFDIIFGNTIIRNNFFQHLQISRNFNTKSVLMPFCHQSVFIKLAKIKLRKFNINYKYSSDFDLFLENYIQKANFLKIDDIISIVRAGGSSDLNRQEVFNENFKILKEKNLNKSYYKLFYYKFLELFKNIFKILVTKKVVLLLLKYKYRNNLIK